ncbi:Transferrin binding protein-like solute binding protein [Kingella potus]|uniref:Transferrin binding protein-like solute binding protein n=1 Tax=Kingella potus TaxID=265175 RepID=A0A377R1D9_9NEIS|nr:Slam-dependent surface lipoprotein [Kingella potus]STR02728.1 Transferrin binding protein-like solute binding protein [Kingella potus]
MKHLKLVAALATVFAASSVYALPDKFESNPDGATSAANTINSEKHIGVSVVDSGDYKGKAAIYVHDENATTNNSKGLANNKHVSFAKIDKTAGNIMVRWFAKSILGQDGNNVTVAHMYKMKGLLWDNIPKMPDHSHLGRMSYAKVGDLDVYFGDWDNTKSGASAVNKNVATNNYTVFYSGTGKTAKMPTSGTATYDVKGINQHYEQGTAVLRGDLKADFGKKTLTGTLSRAGGDLKTLGINANIQTAQAAFSGKAVANNSVNGTTSGKFFGNNAAGLAGIAQFNDKKLNTAYGGAKK